MKTGAHPVIIAFQTTISFFPDLSNTCLADCRSPHLPYMSINDDPIYEFTTIPDASTKPSIHLPISKSHRSPHTPRTLTRVILLGLKPATLIPRNISTASLANPILEYPEIIELHDTTSRSQPAISSNTFRAIPNSPHLE